MHLCSSWPNLAQENPTALTIGGVYPNRGGFVCANSRGRFGYRHSRGRARRRLRTPGGSGSNDSLIVSTVGIVRTYPMACCTPLYSSRDVNSPIGEYGWLFHCDVNINHCRWGNRYPITSQAINEGLRHYVTSDCAGVRQNYPLTGLPARGLHVRLGGG